MICPACGAHLLDVDQVDPETGERFPIWECPACGANLDRAARGQRPYGARQA